MQKVKRHELNAQEDALITKLHKEICFLKEILIIRQKGTVGDMSSKIIKLQEENERLKGMVLDKAKIQAMIDHNEQLKKYLEEK